MELNKIAAEILKFWRERKIFEKSLAKTERAKRFVFFEGPPTANGLPHVGHFLIRIYKDLYGRYKTMRGFFVLRRAGWDTHGLPVEIEVEKELGFKNKKDIEDYGIDKFNQKAKESVWKYKTQWEEMTKKMGFWIDLKDSYITYNTNYIETVWWILKKFFKSGLLYKGHKVLPYCPRCGTALSSHEVAQGYKDITETSVYVRFKITNPTSYQSRFEDRGSSIAEQSGLPANSYLLAWTTTPWTLPGNVALAVGEKIAYVGFRVKGLGSNAVYIAAKDRLPAIAKDYEIIEELEGKDLVGLEYEPLFDIPALKSDASYKIYSADFVTTQEGTGIVHTAVMYGEDDYQLGKRVGLPMHHTVDPKGNFTEDVTEFAGENVKKAEPKIIEHLKNKGLLFDTKEHTHSYPHCWRCDAPLLYYAKDSWFIRMSSLREQLLKNNQKINWIPSHLKDGRFGEFLKEAKDWALSRERFWGTPLPIWQCVQCAAIECIGSIDEINRRAVKQNNAYFTLRHGATTRDELKERIISSRLETDTYPLTEEGKIQINQAAENLKKMARHIDIIFASPFLRTKQSAEIIAKIFHKDIRFDDRLMEIKHGLNCEGKSHTVCSFMDYSRKDFDDKDKGGESWNNVRIRILDFIKETENRYRNKKILIIGHGDPLWLLNGMALGWDARQILTDRLSGGFYPETGQVKKIRWEALPRNQLGEVDLHRPYADLVVLKCHHCKASMKRVPDLVDAWFDSGSMPYAQWHWPFENKKISAQQFPAEFIVEGIDQTRGWFYTLLAIATALGKKPPYKNVLTLGLVMDEHGKKLSKSKKNYKSPLQLMGELGIDPLRWYFYTLNEPGDEKLFSEKDVGVKIRGFFRVLDNSLRFFQLYCSKLTFESLDLKSDQLLDRWLLSRLNNLIYKTTLELDSYNPTTASREIEKFTVEDLSNWWIRRSRNRFRLENDQSAGQMLYLALLSIAKLTAPFIPFSAEHIYSQLRTHTKNGAESIHLLDWPQANKKLVGPKLEAKMELVRKIVKLGLAAREKAGIKIRQPLNTIWVFQKTNAKLELENELEDLVKDELNVKNLQFINAPPKDAEKLLVIAENGLKLWLDIQIDTALRGEGWIREVIRALQDARKELKYKFDERVTCNWATNNQLLKEVLQTESEFIKSKALLKEFISRPHEGHSTYEIEREFEMAPGISLWFGIKR